MAGFIHVAGLALVASCAGLMPGIALALENDALDPIAIDACRINNTRAYVSAYRPIVLTFTNRRAVPANEIHVTVEYAGRTEHIIDRGMFSQNIRIEHAFSGFYNAPYRGPWATCTLDYVEFQDGTVWSPASPASVPKCNSAPPAPKGDRG
jgi:hypothetical protein